MAKPDLSAAYADSQPIKRTRRLEGLARLYTPDAQKDAWLKLSETDPERYNRLPRQIRDDLAYYAGYRDAAAELAKEPTPHATDH